MKRLSPLAEANRWHHIWRDIGPNTYPIDLDKLVYEAINTSSNGDKLEFSEESFDNSDFQGMFRKRGPNDYVAILNSNIRSNGRKNFTKAHELFHFLGHREVSEQIVCGLKDLADYSEDVLEIEANTFASQLLLPPDKIRPYVDLDFTYENVRYLADELGASVSAVAYKWLKLCGSNMTAFFISRDGFINTGYSSDSAFKRGIYFKQGTELPHLSLTQSVQIGGNQFFSEIPIGIWHPKLACREFVHKTIFDDFTYTFLKFYE